ncbi:Angiopoietin-1 [Collichthys lucidus]|uniref:Angiopoietin-1 n=1 Tax=Collichthys lucidus TaxID=240159 RepID=A0A4U5UAM0_COLLU|nr:Angiopoietin-1 [Collichthys lucidus]
MKGLNLSRGILVLLLLWTLSVVAGAAGAAGAVSTERGGAGRSQRRGGGGGGGGGGSGADKRRKFHRIQHGQCSYTFILPELDGCQSGGSEQYGGSRSGSSIVQRDSPPVDGEWSAQKLQHLESTMENNTQWLRKLENVIQKKIKPDNTNIPPHVVHNQTAAMLEIGTNLLTHTAEQTRKLNVVEAKVLNQTSRMEIQLLENSLSTNKLEKELLLQTSEISQLRAKNSRLESKVQILESQQKGELEDMREEKNRLQAVVRTQMTAIEALERQLRVASSNNTALQRQQVQLMESVHTLINMVATTTDAYRAGHSVSGLYHIYISNRSEPVQVYCDMDTAGGGWTVFQRRFNGSVDFQRSWREYKMGFGDVLGEHWLGNEALHLMTSQGQYSLRVELNDWEGNSAYSHYDRFTLANERQQYRLYLRGYSGTAGRQSSLTTHGTGFSTRDQDNDNCDHCKCALMLTGGWWFDACGFSNLNGIYYTVGHNIRKLNGIKWHHFRGPSYSLRSTSMMVRPYDF